MIRLTPFGGASEIGGSCMLLEAFGASVVVDCGMRPAVTTGKYPDLERLADQTVPDALLVTHAHIDHVGALPLFHKRFPGIRMYATKPTIRITRQSLSDAVRIMERDWEGEADFTADDVDALARAFVPVDFNAPLVVVEKPSVRVVANFVRAGHILGAAMVALEIEDRATGRFERVLISGDVSLFAQPTILGTDLETLRAFRPTLFVCEGTYGAEEHKDFALEEAKFVAQVATTLARGGKVLIPAFAVGRAQNIALILRDAMEHPERVRAALGDPTFAMPEVPVYIDGMCRAISDQYSAFREMLAPGLQRARIGEHVFYNAHLHAVGKDREALCESPKPMVLIASSGMLNGGPSVRYAQALAKDPTSTILLVGYQDEESVGARLRSLVRNELRDEAGAPTRRLRLGATEVEIKCQVDQYSLSAHSDAKDMERLIAAIEPEHVLLVHGTPLRLAQLERRLARHDWAQAGVAGAPTFSIGHQFEPLERTSATRRTAARFRGVAPMASRWQLEVLTGRAFQGQVQPSLIAPYVTAALTASRDHTFTEEEAARLTALTDDPAPIGPEDVAVAHETLRATEGLLWRAAHLGDTTAFAPVAVPAGASIATLGQQARSKARDAVVRAVRMSRDLASHRERVAALGVTERDLILFVDAGTGDVRLLPGVVTATTKFGFEVIAPGAIEPVVAMNQIVARVGRWPTLARPGAPPTVLELQLLEAIGRALAAFELESAIRYNMLAAGPSAATTPDGLAIGPVLTSLWQLAERRLLSPEAAFLGAVLLVQYPTREPVVLDLEAVARQFGHGRVVSAGMLGKALHELAADQFLRLRPADRGIEVQWTIDRAGDPVTHPDTTLLFRHLGPQFETLLRQAFTRAVAELEQIGVARRVAGKRWLALLEAQHGSAGDGVGDRAPTRGRRSTPGLPGHPFEALLESVLGPLDEGGA